MPTHRGNYSRLLFLTSVGLNFKPSCNCLSISLLGLLPVNNQSASPCWEHETVQNVIAACLVNVPTPPSGSIRSLLGHWFKWLACHSAGIGFFVLFVLLVLCCCCTHRRFQRKENVTHWLCLAVSHNVTPLPEEQVHKNHVLFTCSALRRQWRWSI